MCIQSILPTIFRISLRYRKKRGPERVKKKKIRKIKYDGDFNRYASQEAAASENAADKDDEDDFEAEYKILKKVGIHKVFRIYRAFHK